MTTPSADEPVSYARDIKRLFRERDRDSMSFALDLWDVADVRSHADAILGRLEAGTMPCDGSWPPEQVDLFRRWIAMGEPD